MYNQNYSAKYNWFLIDREGRRNKFKIWNVTNWDLHSKQNVLSLFVSRTVKEKERENEILKRVIDLRRLERYTWKRFL